MNVAMDEARGRFDEGTQLVLEAPSGQHGIGADQVFKAQGQATYDHAEAVLFGLFAMVVQAQLAKIVITLVQTDARKQLARRHVARIRERYPGQKRAEE